MNNITLKIGVAILIFWLTLSFLFYLFIQHDGMTVTSWWRSPWKNREVGGVTNSLHMLGLAWDVVPPTLNNISRLRALGLKVIDEGDHLHVQIL